MEVKRGNVCCVWVVYFSMSLSGLVISSSPADASTYAHFLFNAFDSAHTGSIKFEVCSHIFSLFVWICLFLFVFMFFFFFFTSIRTLWQLCPSYWGAPLLRSYSGPLTFMISTGMDISTKRCFSIGLFGVFHISFVLSKNMSECVSSVWQEMTDIVKAIYDMMGKYTYPVLKTDAPKQHVDAFFQVTCSRLLFNFNNNKKRLHHYW